MERTFIIIKPDAVKSAYTGKILNRIESEGFSIKGLKLLKISKETAGQFYAVHKERPFYNELVDFMSSGNIVVACLERVNAVQHWRDIIGATDPAEAAENTIRKLYAKSKGENAVHGSDSIENAQIEVAFFFNSLELVS